jgi:HK97 gp10 family phage protein
MAATRIEIVFNTLPEVAARFPQLVADANNRAMLQTVAIADPRTPVDTGHLKNAKQLTSATPGNLTSDVAWTAEYAAYVNFGTARMAAQPFATSAVEEVKGAWLAALAGIGAKL